MQKQAGFKISDLIGIICILIGAGVLIRTACFVMSADIWFDELFTVELAVKPLGEMIELAAQDVHPPLYYILVRMVYIILNPILSAHISPESSATVVSVASASSAVVAAKITSLIPYLGTAAYLLTFIRKKYGLAASGFAFLLIETMPHMSEYMVEARMYSWCAFCLLAMYIHAVEYVDTYTTKHSIFMLIYGVAAMYLHYYGLIGAGIIALGTCIAVCVSTHITAVSFSGDPSKKDGMRRIYAPVACAAACVAIAILAYIPWIHVLLGQIGQVSASYWIQPVTIRTLAGSVKYIFEPSYESKLLSTVAAVAMILGYLWIFTEYIRHLRGSDPGTKIKITSVILTPAVPALLVLSGFAASVMIRPVFVYRYMYPAMFIFWTGAGVMLADMLERVLDTGRQEYGRPDSDPTTGGLFHRIAVSIIACLLLVTYICAGVRSFNLFRWEEMKKAEGMKHCVDVFEQIATEYPDALLVCNFNQVQAILWHYLDNDSVLWGYTDETLIADICARSPIVMTEDSEQLKALLSERGQNEFLFFGSGQARDEIIAEWESCDFFTELLQDSCLLERYYANIYKVGFER